MQEFISSIPAWLVFGIGFLAQFFFASRTILQWLGSERAKMVISPSSYWILSVIGSLLFFIFGVLRNDFSIILGQIIAYYIYLWNLNAKSIWKRLSIVTRTILIGAPVVAVGIMALNWREVTEGLFRNPDLPIGMVIFGSAGQVIFTLRFVYQWLYCRRSGISSLPPEFWMISLLGSCIIVAYGFYRLDPVLILGQSFGVLAYVRNLMIGFKSRSNEKESK